MLIDPVLDFDPSTRTVSTTSADGLLSFLNERGYKVERILETHAHADHLTSARYLKFHLDQENGEGEEGVPVCIGERIRIVQDRFGGRFGLGGEEEKRGAFEKYWRDGETFRMGGLEWEVMPLPGHTPDSVGYKCGEAVFVGDSIFLVRLSFPFPFPFLLLFPPPLHHPNSSPLLPSLLNSTARRRLSAHRLPRGFFPLPLLLDANSPLPLSNDANLLRPRLPPLPFRVMFRSRLGPQEGEQALEGRSDE